MLPSAERLRRQSLFERAYKARMVINSDAFSLYVVLRRPSLQQAKFLSAPNKNLLPLAGFVVGKKVSKSACVRNKVKRRLRESYRLVRRSFELNQLYALVFVIHPQALHMSWTQLNGALLSSLERAKKKYCSNLKA